MTKRQERERDEVVRVVKEHGWRLVRITKRGYYLMQCSCGAHQETIHKTPSNPGHFIRKRDRMISICSNQVA